MAYNYGYYGYNGERLYVVYPEPRFDRDGQQYHGIAPAGAPVTFREPPFYDDHVYYRQIFRDQIPDDGRRHGGLIPREQVLIRREDPVGPWWHNRDFPHNEYGGHRIFIVDDGHHCPAIVQSSTTVELYAPQLCCDSCERRVIDCLNNIRGVEDVTADQWEKKVVVVGRDLQPSVVLRRLQRDVHMHRSVLWEDHSR